MYKGKKLLQFCNKFARIGSIMRYLVICAIVISSVLGIEFWGRQVESVSVGKSLLRTNSLKINVDDMEKALPFYIDKLGFEVKDRSKYPKHVVLRTNDRVKLVLQQVTKIRVEEKDETHTGLTLQVNDLDKAIAQMKGKNVKFASGKRTVGVGKAIFIFDPFGRKIALLHQTIIATPAFKEPKVYNFGVLVPNMKVGIDFYSGKLGFVVRSKRYLPSALPLGHKDASFGFMLHYRDGLKSIKSKHSEEAAFYTIVFETQDIKKTYRYLLMQKVDVVDRKYSKNNKLETLVARDPFGNIFEVVEAVL